MATIILPVDTLNNHRCNAWCAGSRHTDLGCFAPFMRAEDVEASLRYTLANLTCDDIELVGVREESEARCPAEVLGLPCRGKHFTITLDYARSALRGVALRDAPVREEDGPHELGSA